MSIQEAWTMLHNTNHDVPHPGDVDYAMLDMTSLRCVWVILDACVNKRCFVYGRKSTKRQTIWLVLQHTPGCSTFSCVV